MSKVPIECMCKSDRFIPVEPTTHTEDLTRLLGVLTEECNAVFEVFCAILNSDKSTKLDEDLILDQIKSLRTQSSQRVMTLVDLSSREREMIVGSILAILEVKP